MISFEQVSLSSRLPGYQVEFDNSQANKGIVLDKARYVMFGQKMASGTATANVPTRCLSADHGKKLAGRGSMLATMVTAFKKANPEADLYIAALDDNPAGQKAAATVTVTGPASRSSTRSLWVGAKRVQWAVGQGDNAATVAAGLAAAVNANQDLVYTAAVDAENTAKVVLTARHKGEAFNGLDIRLAYYHSDQVDDGLTFAITPFTGGSGNPDLTAAIAGLGDVQYHHAVMPYTDGANLALVLGEFADRNSAGRQIEGQVWGAHSGDHAALSTLGDSLDNEVASFMNGYASPTPAFELAAMYGAVSGFQLEIDPARPLQTVEIKGMMAPAEADRFTGSERNLLLYDGISTYTVTPDGRCLIERAITTYKTNRYGLPDPSYLDVETVATLFVLRRSLRARLSQKFPRHKLADDGTNFGAGQAIVTPSIIKAELIALAREWELRGWVENLDAFKDQIIVERNADDPCRIDALLPPDLVNQFRRFAGLVQFRV